MNNMAYSSFDTFSIINSISISVKRSKFAFTLALFSAAYHANPSEARKYIS